MILDSFLRGLHSNRKLDFKCILLTSDRRQRLYEYMYQSRKREIVGLDEVNDLAILYALRDIIIY